MSDEEETKLDPIAEDLKTKHAEVFSREFEDVGGKPITVYFRPPTRAENDRFNAKAFDDKNPKRQAEGMSEFGRSVIVHPTGSDRDSLIDRRPGIAMVIAGEASRIAAGQGAELGKRL